MPQFKRTISQFLRFPSKFRRPLSQPSEVTLPADTVDTTREPNRLHNLVHHASKSTLLPPADADANEVEESKEAEDDKVSVREREEIEVDEVNVLESEEGKVDEKDEAEVEIWDAEDEDALEPVPFELARKTRIEMMLHHLYVALSDDDAEIAALRTRHCEPFSHVIRITFEPPSVDDELTPSRWSSELSFPSDAPFEVRLTCPEFVRRLGEQHTALTKQQLLLARKYITFSLPYRHDTWLERGFEFPFSIEHCEDARLLIVGPTDRSVDVMAILVCYLTFLTGAPTPKLLHSVRKLDLVHDHWKNCAPGNVVRAVSTH